MANPYVEWTDAQGLCRLTQLAPRFGGWTPDGDPIGPRHAALGTGRPYVYEYRRDYSVRFTVGNFAPWQEPELVRFKLALESGLAITVFTGDSLGNVYTCYLREGATPSIQQDPETLDLSITVELINSALAPIIAQYGLAALVVHPSSWPAFLGGSFTTSNANTRRYFDKNGVGQSLSTANTLRNAHYVTTPVGQRRVLILEQGMDNFVLYSEDMVNHWTKATGAGSATGGQADPFGGTNAVSLSDTDGAVATAFTGSAAPTVGGNNGWAVFIKQGTATALTVGFYSSTASVFRGRLQVTWNANPLLAPTVTPVVGLYLGCESLGNGWWRIHGQATGVVSTDTHLCYIYPADVVAANTGATTFFGFTVSNQGACGTYVQTAGAVVSSQNGETLTVPMNLPPGPSTFYARWVEMGGAARWNGAPRIIEIGAVPGAGVNPRAQMRYRQAAGNGLVFEWIDASGVSSNSTCTLTINIGDLVECVGTLSASGVVTVWARTNGGAWVAGSPSAPNPLPAAWNAAQLGFPGYSSSTGLPILGLERWAVLPFVVNDPDEAATEAR